ncbi:GNAT family N-acetyltransferase [Celeribacter neptunius]|uniref:Acetyltransferase (GNAT) domain-containing protein n=1 Tax=Celeribacter neptunius TaxID=588602 RepID=A0A1I3WQY2_9RHOB|nr:GNAT family N-acetyltransferase [Celeribacter neptunius]SFK10064.1 Acetyltransferase (GNAT) domain-containing protein [Celeribacter neptunius]
MSVTITVTEDVKACLALRLEVFVEEQNVPLEEEIDDLDDVATHFLAMDTAGAAVGTARIYEQGEIGKIGRVCVAKSHRGTGLGARLIEVCLQELRQRSHLKQAKLGAQTHAIGFYERFGFHVIGDEYMDGGIPHQDMVLTF